MWFDLTKADFDTMRALHISQRFSIEEAPKNPADIRSFIAYIGEKYGWCRFQKWSHSSRFIEETAKHPEAKYFLMYFDQKLVGHCYIIKTEHHGKNDIEIENFGLLPEYTKKGLGRIFLYMIFEELFKQYNRVELITRDSNHAGIVSFYTSMGMRLFKQRIVRNDLLDVNDPAVLRGSDASSSIASVA